MATELGAALRVDKDSARLEEVEQRLDVLL